MGRRIRLREHFALRNPLGNENSPWIGALMGLLYLGSGAIIVLRWGLLSYAVAHFVSAILLSLPATLDTSAWYFGNMLLLVAITRRAAGMGIPYGARSTTDHE